MLYRALTCVCITMAVFCHVSRLGSVKFRADLTSDSRNDGLSTSEPFASTQISICHHSNLCAYFNFTHILAAEITAHSLDHVLHRMVAKEKVLYDHTVVQIII